MTQCKIDRGNRKQKSKTKETPTLFGPDGDMYIVPSTFEQDFKPGYNEYVVRGIYHWNTDRSVVYLKGHEVEEDIIATCIHETIHHPLKEIGQDPESEIQLDDEQEHNIIRAMAWAGETLIKDYTLNYNQALRELVEKE